MRVYSNLILLATLCCAVTHAAEQAPATPKPATPPATQPAPAAKPAEAKPNEPAAAAAKPDKAAEMPARPAKAASDQRATPQRFIPSEQVRADFDVSFPIDI